MAKYVVVDSGTSTLSHGAVSVGTSAVVIRNVTSGRISLVVQNLGAVPIFVGGSSVSAANGIRIAAGGAASDFVVDASIYGIAASGTCDVRWMEEAG